MISQVVTCADTHIYKSVQTSAMRASCILLHLLIVTFVPTGELIFGLDDTIERRRGEKITAKGIYRDPVRSSHSHLVKASGLRWLSCMLLANVSWAGAIWGLPFLTVLCPSARYYETKKRRHQKLTERAWQTIALLARWLPGRSLVFVTDSSFAVFRLLDKVRRLEDVSLITRLRIDAQLYDLVPQRETKQPGRPRVKGARRLSPEQRLQDRKTRWKKLVIEHWYGHQSRAVEVYSEICLWGTSGKPYVPIRWVLVRDPDGEFEPQAFLSTSPSHTPEQILMWFVRRWRMEVTFEEARAHLGIETQRQWNDLAIGRSTPLLFGLFSLVTTLARDAESLCRMAASYTRQPSDIQRRNCLVRTLSLASYHFKMLKSKADIVEIPR
jgi:hypothetical protein